MKSLLQELRRRNVFRVGVGYLVLAWVVMQITDLVAPALRLPEWTLSFVTFMGILGFPFALFFAWAFELTPEGIKRSEDVPPEESITRKTAGSLNKIIIGLLVLAVAILLADRHLGLSGHFGGATPTVADAPPTTVDTAPEPTDADKRPRSIAVLPFVNMSGDADQEYFSDGISEELLNGLAKIRELRVAARTSSFAFKGKNQDITHIGEQLKVDTVLEGSVRKSGQRVRITAQLIDVDDGYHLWSETYDRDLTDIFAVQDEISAAIVAALRVHLGDDERSSVSTPVDIQAYNWALQGRRGIRLRTKDALELAVKQYQQAIDIEPDYAEAWAGKAMAVLLVSDDQYGDIPVAEAVAMAQPDIDRALSLDGGLALAHGAQALLFSMEFQYPQALASVEKALAINPSEGIWHLWRSQSLTAMDEYSAAGEALAEAFAIDPLHPAIRANWVQHLVDIEAYERARDLVLPDTREYYQVEWEIAAGQGRWADLWQLPEEARAAGIWRAEDVSRYGGLATFYFLKEPGRAMELLRGSWRALGVALSDPKRMIGEYDGRHFSAQERFERDALMFAYGQLGRYEDVVSLLEQYDVESTERFTGLGDFGGTAFPASYLAQALYLTGRIERAEALAERLSLAVAAADVPEERLLAAVQVTVDIIQGDPSGAVRWLEAAQRSRMRNLSDTWIVFATTPLLSVLEEREDFQAYKRALEAHLNSERARLGWPPVTL